MTKQEAHEVAYIITVLGESIRIALKELKDPNGQKCIPVSVLEEALSNYEKFACINN